MAPSEFLSALRAGQGAWRVVEIATPTISLGLDAPGEIALVLDGRHYSLEAATSLLCELADVPPAYAAALLVRGDTALLCANMMRGLAGKAGLQRFIVSETEGKRWACLSRPSDLLLDRAEVFSMADQAAVRFGFEATQLVVSQLGGSALYSLPSMAWQVDGVGSVRPAIRIRYSLLAGSGPIPRIAHGFVIEGQDRFIGADLVGVRKFKYLRDANKAHTLLDLAVRTLTQAEASQALQESLEAACAVDMRTSHKRELEGAAARTYTCADTHVLACLMGPEYCEDYLDQAAHLRATKTQLALAFIACDSEYAINQAPYAILLKTQEQWDKLVGRFEAAPRLLRRHKPKPTVRVAHGQAEEQRHQVP